jgi:hypothetical protein
MPLNVTAAIVIKNKKDEKTFGFGALMYNLGSDEKKELTGYRNGTK